MTVCLELTDVSQSHVSLSHLFFFDSFLTAPSVGVKPEKLFLALLVAHGLLGPWAGTAHKAGHCAGGARLLDHAVSASGARGRRRLSNRLRRHDDGEGEARSNYKRIKILRGVSLTQHFKLTLTICLFVVLHIYNRLIHYCIIVPGIVQFCHRLNF